VRSAAGYHVTRGTSSTPRANGETDPVSRTVTVRDDLSPAQAAKTLVHELAHIRLGHVESLPTYQSCRGRCEVEAESVAYLVCTGAGVDAGAASTHSGTSPGGRMATSP
jgi:IrrE N-terminal-like domain